MFDATDEKYILSFRVNKGYWVSLGEWKITVEMFTMHEPLLVSQWLAARVVLTSVLESNTIIIIIKFLSD